MEQTDALVAVDRSTNNEELEGVRLRPSLRDFDVEDSINISLAMRSSSDWKDITTRRLPTIKRSDLKVPSPPWVNLIVDIAPDALCRARPTLSVVNNKVMDEG